MPFDPKSAKKAGKKSKRGPAKKQEPSINDKMELLYEKVLDNLLINQDKLTKTERLKLFVTLSGYLFTKNKPVNKQTEESISLKLKNLISFESEDDTVSQSIFFDCNSFFISSLLLFSKEMVKHWAIKKSVSL